MRPSHPLFPYKMFRIICNQFRFYHSPSYFPSLVLPSCFLSFQRIVKYYHEILKGIFLSLLISLPSLLKIHYRIRPRTNVQSWNRIRDTRTFPRGRNCEFIKPISFFGEHPRRVRLNGEGVKLKPRKIPG